MKCQSDDDTCGANMSKLILRTSCILALTLLLSGCYEVKKIFHKGTVKGVSLCIEQNNSTLLSAELIKQRCIKEHAVRNQATNASVRAKLLWANAASDIAYLELARGVNETSDFVITAVAVTMTFYDEEGNPYSNKGFVRTWAEPSGFIEGSIKIKNFGLPPALKTEDINVTNCDPKTIEVSCRAWSVIGYLGLWI